MWFKGEEANEFMKQHKGGEKFLSNYLVDSGSNPSVSKIEVNSLKYPYKEFSGYLLVLLVWNLLHLYQEILYMSFIFPCMKMPS
jgi:hypothetical protein